MGITNLGAVSMSAGGVYNPETVYKKYKVVSANGGSYMYINSTPAAGVPLTDTSHWQQIAAQGVKGIPGDVESQNQLDVIVNRIDRYKPIVDIDVDEAVAKRMTKRVEIETYTDGETQIETATAAGVVTADPGGTATVKVVSNIIGWQGVTYDVPLLKDDNANAIASKIRDVLSGQSAITDHYEVSGETDRVILTTRVPAPNDTTLNIAIAAGTAEGVTGKSASTNTKSGTKDETVHPSILVFPYKWNGYKYWLAYTPYDKSNSAYENPCLAVSNDGENWITPPGVTNPVEPRPEVGYYADPNLFMSPDEKTMYMIWKHTTGQKLTLMRTSTDGVNWAPKQTIIESDREVISPSVVHDGQQYVMWYIRSEADESKNVWMRTAQEPEGPWSEPTLCTCAWYAPNRMWHIDVRLVGNQYHMICAAESGYGFYIGKSNDGIRWVFSKDRIFDSISLSVAPHGNSFYKATWWPAETPEGFAYDVWYGSYSPCYILKTRLTFDKSKKIADEREKFFYASKRLKPWIFCDTFSRPNTTEGLGVSDSGHVWAVDIGQPFGVQDGAAYLTAAANSRSLVDIGASDLYMEIVYRIFGSGSSYGLCRFDSANSYWRFGNSGGTLSIQRQFGGALSTIPIPPRSIRVGDRIGAEFKGSEITLYVNGDKHYSFVDEAAMTGTKIGIHASAGVVRYESIIAKAV